MNIPNTESADSSNSVHEKNNFLYECTSNKNIEQKKPLQPKNKQNKLIFKFSPLSAKVVNHDIERRQFDIHLFNLHVQNFPASHIQTL